jgi:site-specific recombinase XerD
MDSAVPIPLKPNERKTITDSIERYLQQVEVSQDPKTLKAYKQTLRQFERWTAFTYMDEIDHDHLMAYRNWLLKNGNEKRNAKTKGNDKLTADWKALRVNKLVKVTLGLPHGKGPIKKSDLGKMKPNGLPQIYTKPQLEAFFQICKPHEYLRYQALYESAFRKEELMYLEKGDVLVEKQVLRVQSMWIFLERLNQSFPLATAKSGRKQRV